MKRFLCLILCLAMVLASATAQAVDYTLAEKWQRLDLFMVAMEGLW